MNVNKDGMLQAWDDSCALSFSKGAQFTHCHPQHIDADDFAAKAKVAECVSYIFMQIAADIYSNKIKGMLQEIGEQHALFLAGKGAKACGLPQVDQLANENSPKTLFDRPQGNLPRKPHTHYCHGQETESTSYAEITPISQEFIEQQELAIPNSPHEDIYPQTLTTQESTLQIDDSCTSYQERYSVEPALNRGTEEIIRFREEERRQLKIKQIFAKDFSISYDSTIHALTISHDLHGKYEEVNSNRPKGQLDRAISNVKSCIDKIQKISMPAEIKSILLQDEEKRIKKLERALVLLQQKAQLIAEREAILLNDAEEYGPNNANEVDLAGRKRKVPEKESPEKQNDNAEKGEEIESSAPLKKRRVTPIQHLYHTSNARKPGLAAFVVHPETHQATMMHNHKQINFVRKDRRFETLRKQMHEVSECVKIQKEALEKWPEFKLQIAISIDNCKEMEQRFTSALNRKHQDNKSQTDDEDTEKSL